ncbi:hypothetical protein ZWY2020_016605 [Hordeum vulgare]|nr:hypothetical protein ZWY2020_016605 [Hordeum vulgare]
MSSVMERLHSLGLYRFRSDDFPPEYNYNHPAASDTVGTKQQYNRSRSEPAARKPASKTGNKAEKAARAKVATKKAVTAEVRRPSARAARPVQRRAEGSAAHGVLTKRRRPDVGPLEAACVDERADDFINKFRQQLQLQRLNLLLNYKGDAQPRRVADADQHRIQRFD